MKKYFNFKNLLLATGLLFMAFISPVPEEGMYPLSEISKLDLKKAGLKIDVKEVYNPNGVSLIDALVNVTGCTGSFVSPEGLILTNHHCSFDAVAKASNVDNNYLEEGFLAKTKEQEIKAEGITCRITTSYTDVSERVLNAANKENDISKRTTAIKDEITKIIASEKEKDATQEYQVSEMFTGISYVLFRYKVIYDVRLVYVPPRNIGEFGGESDNWVWPRHTGDFSFLRAYVAPDGSPAKYSKDNVPFKPKKYLKINPNGVNENDFIFVLGYPGRTFKHQPSQFLELHEKYQLPYIQKNYEWIINLLKDLSKDNVAKELEVASFIKSLANAEKNYRGKLQGMKRLELVDKRREEEKLLQKFINSEEKLKKQYGTVLADIDEVYKEIFQLGRVPYMMNLLSRNVVAYRLAETLYNQDKENQKENGKKTTLKKENIMPLFTNAKKPEDKAIFTKIISDAVNMPEIKEVPVVANLDKANINSMIDKFYSESSLLDPDKFMSYLEGTSKDYLNDPLFKFVKEMEDKDLELAQKGAEREGKLNILSAKFMDAKREWQERSFVPDANSTLRLTYGHIKGYSPADATYYSPFTTLRGIIEKGEESGDYKINKKLVELYKAKDYGKFKDKKLNDVPVAMLYNTDTSGGNSGSPVLNAYCELIGLNYDRTFEATINDYTWNDSFSRSIGVDVRYILWTAQKIGGADNLLKELGV